MATTDIELEIEEQTATAESADPGGERRIFLSLDGGASYTRGVVFTNDGTILHYQQMGGTSLSRPEGDSPERLAGFLQMLAKSAGLGLEEIHSVNLGVAGVTDLDARERLFKELDRLELTDRAMVTSDVEAAYEVCWGDGPGVLVCVGTGAICWARDGEGNTYRASGRGPAQGGDPGSGFWLGRSALVHLIMNEEASDADLDQLRQAVVEHFGADNFEEAARMAGEGDEQVARVGGLGQVICALAEDHNEVALAILQEGTQGLGEELTQMVDTAGLRAAQQVIGTVGGVISGSALFRRLLEEALSFDLPNIIWQTPALEPVFGAALIAAELNEWNIDRETLLRNWEGLRVRPVG